MDDEGYTSPVEAEGEALQYPLKTTQFWGKDVNCWEDLNFIRKCSQTTQTHVVIPSKLFCTDNRHSSDIVDSLWQLTQPSTCKNPIAASIISLKSSNQPPIYIKLQELIQYLLRLLIGWESMAFCYVSSSFKRNPLVLVKGLTPSSLDNYCRIFQECGEKIRKLQELVKWEEYQDGRRKGQSLFFTVQKSLSSYLHIYRTILMIQGKRFQTLTSLNSFIQPFYHQLSLLDQIIPLALEEGSTNVKLLAELNRLIFRHESPYLLDLLKALFTETAIVYMRTISNWIFRGELSASSDFHIQRDDDLSRKDRRFWTRQFSQSEDIPLFVKESADLIFQTGKSIHLLNEIKKVECFVPLCLMPCCEANEIQMLNPAFSFEELEKLKFEWKDKLDQFQNTNLSLIEDIKMSLSDLKIKSLYNYTIPSVRFPPASTSRQSSEFGESLLSKEDAYHINHPTPVEQLLTELRDNSPNTGQDLGECQHEPERLNPQKFILTQSQPVLEIDLEIFNEKPKGYASPSPEQSSMKISADDSFLLNTLFTESVRIPVQVQYQMVNTTLLHYFIQERQLFHHLEALNDFLLLQNGYFGHTLSSMLIDEIRSFPLKSTDEIEKKIGRFNIILGDAISATFGSEDPHPITSNLSLALVNERDVLVRELVDGQNNPHISSEFFILNTLRLNYDVAWPLNILLTDNVIRHFENLCSVFMQLHRAELLLQQAFLHIKSKSWNGELKRLQIFRHRLHHFVGSLRFYMNTVVVRSCWLEFCSAMNEANSLEEIYDLLTHHIREISSNCFLSMSLKGGTLKLVVRYLAIVESFSSLLLQYPVDGIQLDESIFANLKRKFGAAEQFSRLIVKTLVKASDKEYYPRIDVFLELYDFNNFYETQTSSTTSSMGGSLTKSSRISDTDLNLATSTDSTLPPRSLSLNSTASFYL